MFNMFRTLIYPSSGTWDYSVELPHWSYCSWFDVSREFRCGWVGVVSVLQASNLLFYFTSYVLNMFRTLIYPSSGTCDCSVELPHWSYCSWFDVCREFRCGWIGVVSVLQASTLLFYFTSYVLNMFRTLIYPSSGTCDYSVELPHWSYCSWFDVC